MLRVRSVLPANRTQQYIQILPETHEVPHKYALITDNLNLYFSKLKKFSI